MAIWAISDLHLCFGNPEKTMEIFGTEWKNYPQKLKINWEKNISKEDLVLIAGDVSWSKDLEQAKRDFLWLDKLNGTKLIIKGNHDYWWTSKSKLKKFLPPSFFFIYNNAFSWNDTSIVGARLWDTFEFNFDEYINYKKNPKASHVKKLTLEENEKIFKRELHRLKLSLDSMNKNAKIKIAMTHYPPISATLEDSRVSKILEEYKINTCVFGHLHHIKKEKKMKMFGIKNGINYLLTSSDYLDFKPLKVY